MVAKENESILIRRLLKQIRYGREYSLNGSIQCNGIIPSTRIRSCTASFAAKTLMVDSLLMLKTRSTNLQHNILFAIDLRTKSFVSKYTHHNFQTSNPSNELCRNNFVQFWRVDIFATTSIHLPIHWSSAGWTFLHPLQFVVIIYSAVNEQASRHIRKISKTSNRAWLT